MKICNWLCACALVLAVASAGRAEIIYGVTTATNGGSAGANLVSFDSASPGTFLTNVPISGVNAGEAIRGIDFRPATGELYALSGSTTVGNVGTLYTVNLTSGALTVVGTAGNAGLLPGNTSTRISLDFNPVVDRLRVVAGSNQNYRLNPITGALVAQDGNIAYATGDANFGTTPLLAGAAYTNNVPGATSTTLYGWDFGIDSLATVGSISGSPTSPNSGSLFTVGGPSGLLTNSASLGFDISGATGIAYLQYDDTNDSGATTYLATVDLSTGAVTNVGTFGTFMLDISVQPVPEPSSVLLCGGALAGFAWRKWRRRASV